MRPTFLGLEDILLSDFDAGGVALVVYFELVVLLNFAVDFLLLLSANRLTGHRARAKRCILGAAIGGLYGGMCLCPGLSFLKNWYWCIIALLAITIVSFGWKPSAVRRGALFVLLAMTLGGVASGLDNVNIIALVLAGMAILLLCTVGFAEPFRSTKYVNVELVWKGKRYPLTALVDTGNTLKDPITGSQVMVVNPQIAQKLFQLTPNQLYDPIETMQNTNIPGLRLIPYRAIGCPNGMLLGVNMDSVMINGCAAGRLIAFSPEDFGSDCCYQALAGGAV